MKNKIDGILGWMAVNAFKVTPIFLILFIGLMIFFLVTDKSIHADQGTPKLSQYEVHTFDVREAMQKNGIPDGWTPMLKDFLEKNPDLEYVDSGIAHASGGNGTIDSMFVVTKKK